MQLTDSQQVTLSVAFTDKRGQPAPIDGLPSWGVDNSDVLAITPAADGMSALVAAVGPLGSGMVSVTADSAPGDPVVTFAGTLQIDVTAGPATVANITPGTPEEQP